MFIIATWGKYKGNTQSINFLLSPLKFHYSAYFLFKVSCQAYIICFRILTKSSNMLNKNSLAVKEVRGQSEATMVISDQKL